MRVYLARNRGNGKGYVGKTTRSVVLRWKEHIVAAQNGDTYAISYAIRKHGARSFKVTVLEECSSPSALIDAEIRWIAKLDTCHGPGYNMTEGGEGTVGYKHTEEAKRKIGEQEQYERTPEIRRKLSESRKKVAANPTEAMLEERKKHSERMKGRRNPCYGKAWGRTGPLKEETKRKLSEAHRGKVLSANHKRKIKESLRKLRESGQYAGPNKGKCYPILGYYTDGNHIHTFVNFDAAAAFVGMNVKALRLLTKQGECVKGLLFSKSKTRMDREKVEQLVQRMVRK